MEFLVASNHASNIHHKKPIEYGDKTYETPLNITNSKTLTQSRVTHPVYRFVALILKYICIEMLILLSSLLSVVVVLLLSSSFFFFLLLLLSSSPFVFFHSSSLPLPPKRKNTHTTTATDEDS